MDVARGGPYTTSVFSPTPINQIIKRRLNLSKATEAVDAAMITHQASTHKRQLANSANAAANEEFIATEKALKEAGDLLAAEIVQLAADATQLAPVVDALNPPPKID
jgi:hypothetical protein